MTEFVVPIAAPILTTGGLTGSAATADCYWVGLYPYVEVADEAASGGVFSGTHVPGEPFWIGARFAAWTAPAPLTGARLEFEYLLNTGSFADLQYVDALVLGDDSGATFYGETFIRPAPMGVWTSVSDPSFASVGDLPALATRLALGAVGAIVDLGSGRAVGGMLSMIRLVVTYEGSINQQIKRADGLGRGGVPRARSNGTRLASNSARGAH